MFPSAHMAARYGWGGYPRGALGMRAAYPSVLRSPYQHFRQRPMMNDMYDPNTNGAVFYDAPMSRRYY